MLLPHHPHQQQHQTTPTQQQTSKAKLVQVISDKKAKAQAQPLMLHSWNGKPANDASDAEPTQRPWPEAPLLQPVQAQLLPAAIWYSKAGCY
jgi:hypothetical protein